MPSDTEPVIHSVSASPDQDQKIAVSRVALVTGGARGIGAAIAVRLACEGHRIAIVGRDQAALDRQTGVLRDLGRTVIGVASDLASPDAADIIARAVEDQLGPVEILVNNAGITRDGLFVRMSLEDFNQVLAVDLTAAFTLSKRVARGMMKARWGRIVNISSVVAQMGNVGQANYVSAKAGLLGLTKALALELAPRQVTVNAIAPGFIETNMTAALPAEVLENYKRRIPLARFGAPADVAGVVAFLCSSEAAYVTGQTLRVDGGMLLA